MNVIDANIDVKYEPNLGLENVIASDILIEKYIKTYNDIKAKYVEFYKEGTGYKTNQYHEPVMNKAYNYIEYDNFKAIAKEPTQGYGNNNCPKGELRSYFIKLCGVLFAKN